MKTFAFLFEAIEQAAKNAGTTTDSINNQGLDIIYNAMQCRGTVRVCGQVIRRDDTGCYGVSAE